MNNSLIEIQAGYDEPMEDDLTWLANNVPKWKPGYCSVDVEVVGNERIADFRYGPAGAYTRQQWQKRRAELNPPTSSMTNAQQRQAAIDTGMCSDGRPCGEHDAYFDDYCTDCPNEPKLRFTPEGFAMADQSEQNLDMVNNPSHYQSEMGIECIMAIRAQMTCDQFAAYCQGNAVKYLWRWREKGGVESLKKARWYLYRMIAELEDDTTT